MVLAVCSRDVKFYKWPSMQFLGAYETPTECMTVKTISWNSSGKDMLVIKSKGEPVLIKTPSETQKQMETYRLGVPQNYVSTGEFSKINSDSLALGFEKGDIITFDLKSKGFYRSYGKLSSGIQMLDFSYDDKNLLVGCFDGSIHLYNTPSEPVASFMIPSAHKNFSTLKFSLHSSIFAAGGKEGGLAVWDAVSADCLLYSKEHTACVTDVAFLENSLTSVSRDGFLCIFDLRTSQIVSKNNLDGALSSLAYFPDNNYLVVGTYNQLRCYDIRKLKSPFTTMLINNSGHIKKILAHDDASLKTHKGKTMSQSVCHGTCEYEIESACGDYSFESSIVDSTKNEQLEMGSNMLTEKQEISASKESKFSKNLNFVHTFEKYVDEYVKRASSQLAEKIAQKFYALRINTSKQFIEMEYKIDGSWENFMEYLKTTKTTATPEKSESDRSYNEEASENLGKRSLKSK